MPAGPFRIACLCCVAAAALAGCASVQETGASAPVPGLGKVEVNVAGAMPLAAGGASPMLASRVRVGEDAPVRYQASYTVNPGDVVSSIGSNNAHAPTRLGGQMLGQRLDMRLLEFAGAPLSLGVSSEVHSQWTVSGQVRDQRERASLSWSSSLASLNLEWMGPTLGRDPSLALDCGVQLSLRVPTVRQGTGRQGLSMAGRECRVQNAQSRYGELDAHTVGIAYAWDGEQRKTRLELAMIDPVWRDRPQLRDLDPAWELGLKHSIERGPWSARSTVALRQATVWDAGAGAAWYADAAARHTETWLGTDASVARQLSVVSVSASWVHGADPMWFMPDMGQRNQRFVLGLDFSRGVRHLLRGVEPRLAMRWDWSQARTRDDQVASDNKLALNVGVNW